MIPEAKDAPPTNQPPSAPAQRSLRLTHALLLVALGAWLPARGLQTLLPDARWTALPPFTEPGAHAFAVAALLLGAALLGIALTLPRGSAWAWAAAAVGAPAAVVLLVAAWAISGSNDWLGVLLGMAAIVAFGAPSARELYLS